MNQFDMSFRQINARHCSYADKVQAWFLRWLIAAYQFELEIAINPQVRRGLSATITELQGDLHRLEIQS